MLKWIEIDKKKKLKWKKLQDENTGNMMNKNA